MSHVGPKVDFAGRAGSGAKRPFRPPLFEADTVERGGRILLDAVNTPHPTSAMISILSPIFATGFSSITLISGAVGDSPSCGSIRSRARNAGT
jgi:hypothetical protein